MRLPDRITPLHAFLVIFFALWVVGGLLQANVNRSGKPTSPHSSDFSWADLSKAESDTKVELQLFAVTPQWVMPIFEIVSISVVNDRQPVASIQLHTASLLRGPPVV